jgi:hypothetical protein
MNNVGLPSSLPDGAPRRCNPQNLKNRLRKAAFQFAAGIKLGLACLLAVRIRVNISTDGI